MERFTIYQPTILHFGPGVTSDMNSLPELQNSRALLLIGGGSVKRNGIYDKILLQLAKASATVFPFEGIKSNPEITELRMATNFARQNKCNIVVAVGGGSVIDTAKAIAASVLYENDPWDLYTGKLKPEKAIPLIVVLTLAATGTEMNPYSVCQNNEEGIKTSFGSKLVFPAHSYLDPQFTISVPRDYTAYGISDLVAHAFEAWFGKGEAELSDQFVGAIVREAMDAGPLLLKNLSDINLRARIMYAATCALNGTTSYGRVSGDWGVHGAGHVLSLLYDVPHGASLSVVYPAWLKIMADRIPDRIIALGKCLFGVDMVNETISAIENMFRAFLSPIKLEELKLEKFDAEVVYKHMVKAQVSGYHHKLDEADILQLIKYMH